MENHVMAHDHIKPCCSFNLPDEEEQEGFQYTFLQPPAIDNLVKGGNN